MVAGGGGPQEQVALILDFAANARRMSNTKNVYPLFMPALTHERWATPP